MLTLSREQGHSLLCQVLLDLDTDRDRRITVDDERARERGARSRAPSTGSTPFPYVARAGATEVELTELHQAAQLVQELVVALRTPSGQLQLDRNLVRADPASYLAYRIRHYHWDALTRRIDADPERLLRAATDAKLGTDAATSAELCPALASRGEDAEIPQVEPSVAPSSRRLHVYYPSTDPKAREVFEKAGVAGLIDVAALPANPSANWVLETTRAGRHGLLTLALSPEGKGRPFVVPGGRFNEMYGWDSFFITWGLLQAPERRELARAMIDNQAYEILHYGKILNANRTYYLTRSQPPFFTSALLELWNRLDPTEDDVRWLEGTLGAAIREYQSVWTTPPRKLSLCDRGVCLARYFSEGHGEPPEVEAGHFAWFYQRHAVTHGHCAPPTDRESRAQFLACAEALAESYRSGALKDAAIDAFFSQDRCVRESGHDNTFRFWVEDGERCADFATVDLNALLFKYEIDIATLLERAFRGQLGQATKATFCERAKARARLFKKYLWDEKAGTFFDYDMRKARRSKYLAATALYPLWASVPDNVCGVTLVTPAMAAALRGTVLRELEAPGGLLATSPASLARVRVPTSLQRTATGSIESVPADRQWEAPTGWAPHQMLAWKGLSQAGFEADAQRLTYRWLYTIVTNAASYHGTVPEKFDVVARSHAVFQEYGNVNTEFAYIADEGFGWMNASFVVGWQLLGPRLQSALERQIPPERLFAP